MLIRSQDGASLVYFISGLILENGKDVLYQSSPDGKTIPLGRYETKEEVQSVLKKIEDNVRVHHQSVFQMPKAK